MTTKKETSETVVQAAICDYLFLNTSMEVYYDGAVKCGIRIEPSSLRELHDAYPERNIVLDKLWLEIPIKKEVAKYYHVWPLYEPILIDGKPSSDYWVDQAFYSQGDMPEKSLATGFKHSIYLGNDDVGLSVFFETHKGWTPSDNMHVIEALVQEDCVLLRVHLLDSEHDNWLKKDKFKGCFMHPIMFSFGMQATPVKPFPANPFEDKACQICAIKRDKENNETELLFTPLENVEENEIALDTMKKAGVTTVMVHETWNDIQNGVWLTEESANRLRKMVKAAHDRGMKILPYFGYELASLDPMCDDLIKYRNIGVDEFSDESHWTRRPYQRDYIICNSSKSEFNRYWLDGIEKLMVEFGFDGLYLDGTYAVKVCANEAHGCGWRDRDGKLHQTFPIWGMRDTLEELYIMVHKHGGVIDAHTSNNYTIPAIAFADTFWDGEPVQGRFLAGKVDSIPEGHVRSMYSGRNLGIPIRMICSTNKNWSFHEATACVLPYGLLPKPNGNAKQLKEMSTLWNIYDSVPMAKAKFIPYYKTAITTTNDFVKASYYDYNDAILAIVVNMKKAETGVTEVTFPENFKCATNRVTGEKVELKNNNTLTVEFNGIDYSIIELTR